LEHDAGGNALVLLSGGLDSTVACAMAGEIYNLRYALFFDYGQHPAAEERVAVAALAKHFNLDMIEISLPWMKNFSSSSLVAAEPVSGGKGMSPAWVENRNGIFIDIAASIAAEKDCRFVVVGFNREEAVDFPDNRVEYLDAVNRALTLGVSKPVTVVSPTINMDKREIVTEGLKRGVPWEKIWSCYRSGDVMCGTCESCLRLKRAIDGTPVEKKVRFGD